MDRDILNEVVEAEKCIQRSLDAEQERYRQWLDEVRREAEASVRDAERNGGGPSNGNSEAVLREAEARAAGLAKDAAEFAARLERLDDGVLRRLILGKLPRILMS